MTTMTRLVGLSMVCSLLLTSCGLFSSSSTEVAPAAFQTTAALELSVQVDPSLQYTTVGQAIRFNFGVKNTGQAAVAGNAVINGITSTCQATNTVNNLNDSLDPGETVGCTADYVLTQADLDRGSVTVVATATINGINSNQANATVPVGTPKVLVAGVTADTATYAAAAQVITFTYSIKNGGTTALGPDQFRISSSLAGNQPAACGNPNITIAPNETISCQVQYAISAADMNAASIVNQVTASGGGVNASQPASVTLTKGAAPSQTNLTPGATIQHTVELGEWLWHIARCYGADPLSVIQANRQLADPAELEAGMVLTIPNIGSKGKIYGKPCVVAHKVAAGDTWTSIAQLYNADPYILQMIRSNSLTVGGTVIVPKNSAGSGITPPPTTRNLLLSISVTPQTYDQVNQQITFTYTLTNLGSTALGPDQFRVYSSVAGSQPINCGNPNTSIAPNTTLTCTAVYVTTQADMNAAGITNTVYAVGGGAQSQTATASVSKPAAALTLTVSASPQTFNQAGQQVTFKYIITNTGNTALGPAQFTITDVLIGASAFNCGAANATLAPGTSLECTALYTISQNDVNVGSVINLATANGGGVPASQPKSVTLNKQ